jgi:hypothetical protein
LVLVRSLLEHIPQGEVTSDLSPNFFDNLV